MFYTFFTSALLYCFQQAFFHNVVLSSLFYIVSPNFCFILFSLGYVSCRFLIKIIIGPSFILLSIFVCFLLLSPVPIFLLLSTSFLFHSYCLQTGFYFILLPVSPSISFHYFHQVLKLLNRRTGQFLTHASIVMEN